MGSFLSLTSGVAPLFVTGATAMGTRQQIEATDDWQLLALWVGSIDQQTVRAHPFKITVHPGLG